ncbi:type II and III secretion system protein family protein [Caulifigura coniformis]|nr:pilus assembly protein N-terminal domain-containing protein [Caulifigura coniformis]
MLGAASAFLSEAAIAQGPWAPPAVQQHYPAHTVIQRSASPVQQTVGHLPVDPRAGLDDRIESMPRVDQKLEVIHHRSQLVRTRTPITRTMASASGVIDIVPYSDTEFSILGLQLGMTDLLIWFENDPEPLKYAVTVIRDPELEDRRRIDYGKIERKLQILYPNSKVWLIPLSRRVIVRGQARDPEEATRIMQTVRLEVANLEYAGRNIGDDYVSGAAYDAGAGGAGTGLANGYNNLLNSFVVDELRVPGEFQVKVRVRIAELSHMQLRRYGADLGVAFNDGQNIIRSSMAQVPVISGMFDNGNVNCLLDALAVNGTAKIIEDATFVTLSGEPAAFLAGGEFAVPTTVGIGGAAAATTTFRGYGTSVIATPTVIDNDRFRLQVVAELSALNNQSAVAGIPGLNVKRVQTRVELQEGQTIVLGGLYGRTQRADVSRIPFLGEIPVIGTWMFNTKKATEDENELLIVVTPELVRAIDSDQQPPLPGFHVTHPDCYDFWKYNRTEGNPDLGHYQMLPYGHGESYAQDVGYNVFNPAPAPGGMAPQSGFAAGGYQSMPAPPQNGGYAAPGQGPVFAPSGVPPQPTMAPSPAPQQVGPGPQAYRGMNRGPVQQTAGVRGVPRQGVRPSYNR